jgi:ABC-type transporter Mla subunit MlaD
MGEPSWWHIKFDIPSRTEIMTELREMSDTIMATLEDIEAQIAQANAATNDIAGDIQQLKERLDSVITNIQGQIDEQVQGKLQEVSDALTPLVNRLENVAAGDTSPQ